MKKILSILLVLVLTTACIAASAAGYTLPEKMERQLTIGSGLKGAFTLHGEGLPEETKAYVNMVEKAKKNTITMSR